MAKVTTKQVKAIAEKVGMINALYSDINDILTADNYCPYILTPVDISLPLCDVVELAKVCKKKPEARMSWGTWTVSFTIYGCTFSSSCVRDDELNYCLENGSVRMRGEKNG